ncbi:hypothetical protein [Helicobacter pylori]|nr:NADH dehydrogenase subunit C [Helicobacter pylori Gambia94/24]EJC12084.1 NADH dehydrogenase subunit C [Helicobacter pylori Hp P-25]EJC33331.1 NADH dehydrogenase subunit C [Helicobacter pylori Hp P-25c]EJC38901.1 NADH dehydrogenase subunit C [Helicobacter pylori Hp P-25d]
MVRKQSPYEDVQKQSRQHDPYKIIEPTPKWFCKIRSDALKRSNKTLLKG